MATGPGKYDELCSDVRIEAEAAVAIVIVINGKLGSGFSMQSVAPNAARFVPAILEDVARGIRAGQTHDS